MVGVILYGVLQMAGSIFLSYRRDDTAGYAGRLYDRLKSRFPGRVFMDVGAIAPGSDFAASIENAVGDCAVLIALIGKQWLSQSRLQHPSDFVRLEIAAALKRGIRVIPVLVGGATMPASSSLPEDLTGLLRRQAVGISDEDWDAACERLVAGIEKEIGAARKPQAGLRWVLMGAGLALAAVVGVLVTISLKTHQQSAGDLPHPPADPPKQYVCSVANSYDQAADAMNDLARQISGEPPAQTKKYYDPTGRWRMKARGQGHPFVLELRANRTAVLQRSGAGPNWGCWSYAAIQNLLTLTFADNSSENMQLQVSNTGANSFVATGTDRRVYDLTRE
jgi:hypothetical protein